MKIQAKSKTKLKGVIEMGWCIKKKKYVRRGGHEFFLGWGIKDLWYFYFEFIFK